MLFRACFAALVVTAACSSNRYVYKPVSPQTVRTDGRTAGVYPVPPERPQGEVRVLSYGIRELGHQDGSRFPTLHARLILSNNSDARPWTVDTRDVRVEIRGEGTSPPLYVNSNQQALPQVVVSPGEQRVLDLYFPVPGNLDSASEIPTFDVTWKIQTADRVVAMRTPFERRDVVSPPAYPDVYTIGWGPHWWYHDGYGYGRTYVHRPRVIVRPHGRVIVHDHSRR